MIFSRYPIAATILTALAWATVGAQENDAGTEPADGYDGPITVLDQVVPVADETPAEGPPVEEEPDPREALVAEFDRFKQLRENKVYDEAENVAKRIVEMAIRISGPQSADTSKALTNLGIIQHQTGNYEAAQQNFATAIEIIENNTDHLNATLVNPLKGLGQSQLASGRPDLASRTYRRAVHITHVNEGPHNLEQVEILEALAETNIRLGALEDARNNHDMIYALNLRNYDDNAMEIVPSLVRRAAWQRRTGYILDERATHRRIIRIIESVHGKEHLLLIDPLLKLGESYFYVDTSETQPFQTSSIASAEMYYKRAVRIAAENPDSDWTLMATTRIALGDYYNSRSDQGRARKSYREAWELLSEDPDNAERLDARRRALETVKVLNEEALPRFAGGATRADQANNDDELREGRVIFSYNVSTRGRVTGLKIVEMTPPEFEGMRRSVQRELRTRIFRPRFEDAEPVETPDRIFSHTFYYLQGELDKIRDGDTDES
ncbi:MAG: tetratricopeptide repeat protein [Woeseiaceae bacterium]